MNSRDAARLQSFRRAVQCIRRHPELEAALAPSDVWPSLQAIVTHLAELEVRQSYAGSRGKELKVIEDRLCDAARDLIRTVAVVAVAKGLDATGRRIFPNPNSEASTAEVILAARTCAELAPPHADVFVWTGMSPTFIMDLQDAAAALEQAIADRVDAAASGRGATAAIPAMTSRAGKMLGVLDALLYSHLTAETLAEWKQATRLGRSHRPCRAIVAPAPEALPAEPVVEALPAPAPLKSLPPARVLEALIVRLLRRADPVERGAAEHSDVSVEEIRRLPLPRPE
jgi:hypothetical protein